MKIEYKEILKLKGRKLLDTVTGGIEKIFTVTSVTKRNIVLNNGITIKTDLFYETKQANYELLDEKVERPSANRNKVSPEQWSLIVARFDRKTTQEKRGVIWELVYDEQSRHVASYNPKLKRVYTDGGSEILKIIDGILTK